MILKRIAAGCTGTMIAAAGAMFLEAIPAYSRESELNISLAGAVYEPWDGQTGHGVILSAQYALEKKRFWIGLEAEHREFEGNLESGFSPTYNSILFRGLFHFHPFPEAIVSPYLGVGTGLVLHITDRKGEDRGERKKFRRSVSAGTTFLGLLGVQTPAFGAQRFSLFAEVRIESVGDVWKKRGGNWRYDQVGGVTGMMGLRARF